MTDQHPLTDKTCYEIQWKDGADYQDETDIMRAAADWQLEQVIEWLNTTPYFFCPSVMAQLLQKAMRPTTQEDN